MVVARHEPSGGGERADILRGARPSHLERKPRPISRCRACAVGVIPWQLCIACTTTSMPPNTTAGEKWQSTEERQPNERSAKPVHVWNARPNPSRISSFRSPLVSKHPPAGDTHTTTCFSRHVRGTTAAVVPAAHPSPTQRERPGPGVEHPARHRLLVVVPRFPRAPVANAIHEARFFEVEHGQRQYDLRYL